ncbi:hypothetical protein BpHYR1_026240 [Brachionus plicatilis]|uniref:Uncharacterized protein n=1 Tax=Brachionus plicatilis TaxID=10195 RepID=A0A3M7T4B2_BRAPC|nr:hypothetical protein BpHYR1_026240 [Brachionus plicatilis]
MQSFCRASHNIQHRDLIKYHSKFQADSFNEINSFLKKYGTAIIYMNRWQNLKMGYQLLCN